MDSNIDHAAYSIATTIDKWAFFLTWEQEFFLRTANINLALSSLFYRSMYALRYPLWEKLPIVLPFFSSAVKSKQKT